MQVVLPDNTVSARLILNAPAPMTDDDYFAFCTANPDLQIERTSQGEIVIAPPAGGELDYRTLELGAQLRNWARRDARGRAFGSSVEFLLPDGAALSPDAAWVSDDRLAGLTYGQRRKFLRVVPEFVAEILSPSDRLAAAQAKMEQWIANGVLLGWLIHGDTRTIYVYRPGVPVERHVELLQLEAGHPLPGFEADLGDIWLGLKPRGA